MSNSQLVNRDFQSHKQYLSIMKGFEELKKSLQKEAERQKELYAQQEHLMARILLSKANQQDDTFEQKAHKSEMKTPALDSFCLNDLTEIARQQKTDPVIGRDDEITSVMQILAKRTNNNPLLVGPTGVGKDAIVIGLAQRIAQGNVSPFFLDKRILVLDYKLLLAGTKYRGQLEDRIHTLIHEVQKEKNIVLYIEELDLLHKSPTPNSELGFVHVADMLKSALSDNDFPCIGTTTPKNYQRWIGKDEVFDRRFQVINVTPPTAEETLFILKGLKACYEKYHNVAISDDALATVIQLSETDSSSRCFPGKAIDLMDEACAVARLKHTYPPIGLSDLDQQIEALNKQKEEAVNAQDFDKAIEFREQSQQLIKKKNEEWQQSHPAIVDQQVVTEVFSKRTRSCC